METGVQFSIELIIQLVVYYKWVSYAHEKWIKSKYVCRKQVANYIFGAATDFTPIFILSENKCTFAEDGESKQIFNFFGVAKFFCMLVSKIKQKCARKIHGN